MALAATNPQQMYMAQRGGRGGPSGLADVLEVLLDKGLVIDAFVRVSLVGIELLTIDARVVVASVDTYLRFAEAVNRLDLLQVNNSKNLGDLVGGSDSRRSDEKSNGSAELGSGSLTRDTASAQEDGGEDRDADEQSGSRAEDQADEDRSQDTSDDKGILTRLKERGQVF